MVEFYVHLRKNRFTLAVFRERSASTILRLVSAEESEVADVLQRDFAGRKSTFEGSNARLFIFLLHQS